jgi:hypothetical protein
MVVKEMGKHGAWCECDECGKLFWRWRSHVGEYNQFCSRECHLIWEGREWEWDTSTLIKKIGVFHKIKGWNYNLWDPSTWE